MQGVTACKDCQKKMVWMKMLPTEAKPNPRPAPIELDPDPSFNLVVDWNRRIYRFATPEEREFAKAQNKNLYRNHFASCPNAIARRKAKSTKEK